MASITYRDEELWSEGFGVTRKGPGGITPTKDTIYRIASVSKIFAVSGPAKKSLSVGLYTRH